MGPAHPKEMVTAQLKVVSLATLFTSLVACGDPAPGEGVDSPVGEEPMPKVVSASEAIKTPNIAALDPSTLQKSEIDKVLPAGPRCSFAYTGESPPVLAASVAQDGGTVGVIKLHGRLVRVTAPQVRNFEELTNGAKFKADEVALEVRPEVEGGGRRPAQTHFSVGNQAEVGYNGWYSCDPPS